MATLEPLREWIVAETANGAIVMLRFKTFVERTTHFRPLSDWDTEDQAWEALQAERVRRGLPPTGRQV